MPAQPTVPRAAIFAIVIFVGITAVGSLALVGALALAEKPIPAVLAAYGTTTLGLMGGMLISLRTTEQKNAEAPAPEPTLAPPVVAAVPSPVLLVPKPVDFIPGPPLPGDVQEAWTAALAEDFKIKPIVAADHPDAH